MKTRTKKVFYCDFCKKHGLNKSQMDYHESICSKNPTNERPCFSCRHLIKKETVVYGEYYDGSGWERRVDLLFCNSKKIFLYTPKNQIKGNHFDLGNNSNELMPKECEIYQDELLDIGEVSNFFNF